MTIETLFFLRHTGKTDTSKLLNDHTADLILVKSVDDTRKKKVLDYVSSYIDYIV